MKFANKLVEFNCGMEPGVIRFKRSGSELGIQPVDFFRSYALYTAADTLEMHPSTHRQLEERHKPYGGRS